jgi:uncharacterized membrane protein YsdA (DUF1294 family)
MSQVDQFAAGWFALWSVIAFFAFGYDKWRAGRPGQRTPEVTLVLFGAIGGWLGGLVGMTVFRHKTAKWTFKFKYALALLPFAAEIWAWLHFR